MESFINSAKKIANTVSTNKNVFVWDQAIRRFQFGVTGVTLTALAIYEATNKVQCYTPTSSYPEFFYASSYCHEAVWYHITKEKNSHYNEFLRNFKWYVLIPCILSIISSALYGGLVDSFIIRAMQKAEDVTRQGSIQIETSAAIERSPLLLMAFHARVFAITYLHSNNRNDGRAVKRSPQYSQIPLHFRQGDAPDGVTDEGNDFILSRSDYSGATEKGGGASMTDKLGKHTALYYHFYLGICVLINSCALGFINPYFFWYPPAIGCYYRKRDLSEHWTICSLPGHRYSNAAVVIITLSYVLGILVPLLSYIYLNYYIPAQLRHANAAITSYTRNIKEQERIHQCWDEYGKLRVQCLTATTRFILALIYQNIDRDLCYKLIVAMIDIKKDREAIDRELPKLIDEIVEIDEESCDFLRIEKDEMICEIRETILTPVVVDQVKENIQRDLLVRWVSKYLDDPNGCRRDLLKAQMVHQVIGVQLPKQSKKVTGKFSDLLRNMKESDFTDPVSYYRHVAALYDITKNTDFFSVFEPLEIGKIRNSNPSGHVIDNGHLRIDDLVFDARTLFDGSGYCYRSKDVTAYNWIRRSWDQVYSIKCVAIQASHVNEIATPTHFNVTAALDNVDGGTVCWGEISEMFQSYHWRKDEWRVFPLFVYDGLGKRKNPLTKSIQINIFKNGGADYFEIQKIRIYGTIA